MKRAVAGGLFLLILLSPAAYAQTVVDAGNAVCPVGGDKVSGKDFVEHNGKKYGLCCAMCADKLSKNPEKYLAEMEMGTEEESHEGHDHPME